VFNQPILTMLDCLYPTCARKDLRGSTASPPRSALLIAGLLGEASGEQVGDAPHLFAGQCSPHRIVREPRLLFYGSKSGCKGFAARSVRTERNYLKNPPPP
jgi:hypothetical protein